MRRALRAEWTKLWTVPSTGWLLPAVVLLTVGAGAAAMAAVDVSQCPSPAECFEDTTRLSLDGVRLGQAAVAVLAVLVITGEYGTGLMGLTLAAFPRRVPVLLAKAGVLAAAVAVAGTVAVLGSLAAGRGILPAGGFTAANGYPGLSLADGPTLRAAVGTVLYLVLVALLALGVGAVVRDTAAALTLVLSLLYLAPVLASLMGDQRWRERIEEFSPMPAGLAIQSTRGLDRLPIAPWPGLGVLLAYSAAALLLGTLLLARRDA
ncbi:ABC transporter permease [Streptomyces hoynatensis]|uniref:ABC transporter permease n=1 Tax=Streptomyces hoynatensis TaxID=1141874 RepID=A0A3A9Z3F1_9ACTN|nr:ABC transporter permease [Streptomyces hoynatensis]RKN43002.1 ABC transporter permease [Streptomyces hoynatensis]